MKAKTTSARLFYKNYHIQIIVQLLVQKFLDI